MFYIKYKKHPIEIPSRHYKPSNVHDETSDDLVHHRVLIDTNFLSQESKIDKITIPFFNNDHHYSFQVCTKSTFSSSIHKNFHI